MDEYWEPWKPKKGDRVRITLNGECDVTTTFWDEQNSGKAIITVKSHPKELNNQIGTVMDCPIPTYKETNPRGHNYYVRLETLWKPEHKLPNGTYITGIRLAACELVPAKGGDV